MTGKSGSKSEAFLVKATEGSTAIAGASASSQIAPIRYVGWFDSDRQDEPTFDPGDVPCVICHNPWTPDTVRTLSLMWEDRHVTQSLFYRVHRSCEDALTNAERGLYDEAVLEKAPYSL